MSAHHSYSPGVTFEPGWMSARTNNTLELIKAIKQLEEERDRLRKSKKATVSFMDFLKQSNAKLRQDLDRYKSLAEEHERTKPELQRAQEEILSRQ